MILKKDAEPHGQDAMCQPTQLPPSGRSDLADCDDPRLTNRANSKPVTICHSTRQANRTTYP